MFETILTWHPIFVHFTVSLYLSASALFVVCAVLPKFKYREQFLLVARWNIWLGALATLGTLAAGWYEFNTVAHDEPSHAAMRSHRAWALLTAGMFFILAAWQFKFDYQKPSTPFILIIIFSSLLLLTTAYKGGDLVYRHGLGVMSLPDPEDEEEHEEEEHGHHLENR